MIYGYFCKLLLWFCIKRMSTWNKEFSNYIKFLNRYWTLVFFFAAVFNLLKIEISFTSFWREFANNCDPSKSKTILCHQHSSAEGRSEAPSWKIWWPWHRAFSGYVFWFMPSRSWSNVWTDLNPPYLGTTVQLVYSYSKLHNTILHTFRY